MAFRLTLKTVPTRVPTKPPTQPHGSPNVFYQLTRWEPVRLSEPFERIPRIKTWKRESDNTKPSRACWKEKLEHTSTITMYFAHSRTETGAWTLKPPIRSLSLPKNMGISQFQGQFEDPDVVPAPSGVPQFSTAPRSWHAGQKSPNPSPT